MKELRGKQKLFLRLFAAQFDMDTAQLSKIEKGSMHIKWDQLVSLEKLLIIKGRFIRITNSIACSAIVRTFKR